MCALAVWERHLAKRGTLYFTTGMGVHVGYDYSTLVYGYQLPLSLISPTDCICSLLIQDTENTLIFSWRQFHHILKIFYNRK